MGAWLPFFLISSAAIAAAATVAAATISSTTATAAISSTAATVTAVASATPRLIGFLYGQALPTDGCIVQCLYRSFSFGFVGHLYKPKAFTPSRLPIQNYLSKIHRAI